MKNHRSRRAAGRAFVHDYLPYLLGQANHAVHRVFAPRLRAAGLASTEWRVLATLSDGDGLTIGELAAEVLAQQPTLTKLVDRMERAGLVERRGAPARPGEGARARDARRLPRRGRRGAEGDPARARRRGAGRAARAARYAAFFPGTSGFGGLTCPCLASASARARRASV
jgi:DNA-binding transcriptional ArsR family regulator